MNRPGHCGSEIISIKVSDARMGHIEFKRGDVVADAYQKENSISPREPIQHPGEGTYRAV
jgi:hypothetical protein